MTEWLRCTIRNRLGLSRVGSSPASIENFFHFWDQVFVVVDVGVSCLMEDHDKISTGTTSTSSNIIAFLPCNIQYCRINISIFVLDLRSHTDSE